MKNSEVYLKDPSANALLNNGVANANDAQTDDELRVLRYELETFVCDGEYAEGLRRVVESFLAHLDDPQQPGIWVSGFYGSGKSHFVKMLRALWIDFKFASDGATARSLTRLPAAVADPLRDLSNQAKRHGTYLHAASGTLGAGAQVGGALESVRMALLAIVFRSVGLSSDYPVARFEIWLRDEGIFDQVKTAVEAKGKRWEDETHDLHVSTLLPEALLAQKPGFAPDAATARAQLRAQFALTEDVSNDEMVKSIRRALSRNGKLPLTLVALDEIQQYIGDQQQRSMAVQEVTETCERAFGGRLLFVGTGQSALSGTPSLSRLKARFPAAIELSDTDVDNVVRQVILAKKPAAVAQVTDVLTKNLGEISRHLAGTKLGHRADDVDVFAADYPLLPVRRRFWERVLRAVDQAGTQGQLRNQLKMVYEAAQRTKDAPLGTVVAADLVFSANVKEMVTAGVLPREIHEHIHKLETSGEVNDRLKARILGLVFLIGKLPREAGADLGVRATADALADLLVDDLHAGSSELRRTVPALLQELEADGRVMRVDNEYRVQTREGILWNTEYKNQLQKLLGNPARIAQEQADLLRKACGARLKNPRITHGACKEPRDVELDFGVDTPKSDDATIHAWVRNGWDEDEAAVVAEARAAGHQSSLIYLYLPARDADELKKTLANLRAAKATLDIRGTPVGAEADEARTAMESRRADAERRLEALLDVIFSSIHVYLGGGQEILSATPLDALKQAAEHVLDRLFPKFHVADHPGWGKKVLVQAQKGAGDALEGLGYKGDPEKHPVTAEILKFVAGGKKGAEIRKYFEGKGYGWPKDAIEASLYVLLVSGHLRATDASNKPIEAAALDRVKISGTNFRVEGVTITAPQRIQIRKLIQEAGISCTPNEELQAVAGYLATLKARAAAAGGEAPRPGLPDTKLLAEVSAKGGNEQLLFLFEKCDELGKHAREWDETGKAITQRMPRWTALTALLVHARVLPEAADLVNQADAVRDGRLLLQNPDPVPQLVDQAMQLLRAALVTARQTYASAFQAEVDMLVSDPNWTLLEKGQRDAILTSHGVEAVPPVATGTEAEILASLGMMSLGTWRDRREALPSRFTQVRLAAAKLVAPEAVLVSLPSRTLKDEAAVRAWVAEVQAALLDKVKVGPVVV